MSDFKVAELKPVVEFADFEKLDIRVGTIVRVDEIENSKKLVKLTVAFGDRERTILSGMKQERENVKEIEGKQTLFLLNLAPRKMAGELSEGMILDVGYADGLRPALLETERTLPDGARAG